eukprot:TRINITY_DN1970_c0_g1_i3.p1 TRINITY_DN1970_c0_g1~~TRINITY_DN1970_c0_g1_i3.p1  ORF type:complete len:452 (-),score=74.72 TRINITY_DN1970_c0_g1_i3:49-1404(-)
MDFSELYNHTAPNLCKFSPSGKYIATTVKYRLVIRDVETLQIVQLYSCLDIIQELEWSPDSQYVLCVMYKRATIQVWCVDQPKWTCKIDEGPAGLSFARWSSDGRNILSTAEFQIRITVWSLVNRSMSYLRSPKFPGTQGISFSPDQKYVVIAERKDCKDYLSVYSCESWETVKTFKVDTSDLVDVSWSPDGSNVVIWDSPLDYKLLVYSPDGRLLSRYQAYENALGIRTVQWSPNSQFVSVGSFDQKLRILNHITWKILAEFSHPQELLKNPTFANVIVYKEVGVENSPVSSLDGFPLQTKYIVIDDVSNVSVPFVKPLPDKPNPKVGVSLQSWSSDSRLILTKNSAMPTALWIWDVSKLSLLALILQLQPVKTAKWDPNKTRAPRLALCTSNGKIYFWRPNGCSCVVIPLAEENGIEFQVNSLEWSPDGNSLLLIGKDRFSSCYLPDDW